MPTLRRIEPPSWASAEESHVVEVREEFGEEARAAFRGLLPAIYESLDRKVNEYVNDPERCYLDADADSPGFPLQSELGETYYVAEETYWGGKDADGVTRLYVSIHVHCTVREPVRADMPGDDYLGLEAMVNLPRGGTAWEMDELNSDAL